MLVQKLDPDAKLPTKAHATDAGLDLYAIEDATLTYNNLTKVKTGIAVGFDKDTYGLFRDRSSMAAKGIVISGGVIDNDYTGELVVMLTLMGSVEPIHIKKGDKIAQMLILPIVYTTLRQVEELPKTDRGNKGFGSSGN